MTNQQTTRAPLPLTLPWSVPVLAEHARALLRPGTRHLLGLAGAPGAGKSTLAAALCEALGPTAARVPMDGFHLANQVLRQLGLAQRKGAPATFDAGGFHALLRRLRINNEEIVYAPEFFRELEEPVAGALPIPRDTELIIVEGNYLLLDDGPWQGTAQLFDEVWYLRPDETVRQDQLLRRHREHGRSAAEAEAWVAGNDEPNARVVASTALRADKIIMPAGPG
ncbi:MAG TPA: nucleoside/nucleotide kinase family protein [Pseudonocardiaceae bacterium]|jgi:pantothenate kinase|nr:nucleoside/nucleotide kinase family protein [Pseudonocardiaceae bacterium]